jgi:hypothetical protein
VKLTQFLKEGQVIEFEPRKQQRDIDQLLKTKIAGNYKEDMPLWDALEKYITDEKKPMALRIKALRKLDQIHGEVQQSYTANDVESYIKTLNADMKELQR